MTDIERTVSKRSSPLFSTTPHYRRLEICADPRFVHARHPKLEAIALCLDLLPLFSACWPPLSSPQPQPCSFAAPLVTIEEDGALSGLLSGLHLV